MPAVVLTPSQGQNAAAFAGTARQIVQDLYGPRDGGTAFETVVSRIGCGKYQVDFVRAEWDDAHDKTDFWTAVTQATTFIVVSDMGVVDGPILNHCHTDDEEIPEIDRFWQPWPSATITFPAQPARRVFANYLSPEGKGFWQRVGGINKTRKLKIVLWGCDSNNLYGPMVAADSKCPVFGFLHTPDAASHDLQIPNLTTIEETGKPPRFMSRVESNVPICSAQHVRR